MTDHTAANITYNYIPGQQLYLVLGSYSSPFGRDRSISGRILLVTEEKAI